MAGKETVVQYIKNCKENDDISLFLFTQLKMVFEFLQNAKNFGLNIQLQN